MSDLAPAGSGSRSEELGEAVPGRPTSAIGGDARSPVGAAARTGRWRRRHPRSPEVILVVAFAVSRIVAASVGVRFDASVLDGTVNTDMWQLLDVRLLKDQLIQSVWHLNSQPPLFNLYGGWLLKLPSGCQQPVETFAALCLGLVIVLCTYRLMVELGVHDIVALVVTLVGVVASPSYLLYENWLNYAYPTAACGVFGAWCLIRYLRTHRARFGLGFFSAYAVMVLVNSTYQIEWLVLAGVVVLVALRHRWRQVVAVAAVPLVVVLTWYVKDAALFGTTTTSSWLGMNLSRDVLYKAPPSEIARMQQEGTLTPLASVPAFGAPGAYVPKFVRARPSSIAALGALTKADGATNFNNPIYISVSSQYLRDDIAFIRAHPSEYAADVGDSMQVWLVSTDQNFINSADWPHVRTYAQVYDRLVEWQPTMDPAPAYVLFRHTSSPLSWLSLQAVAVYALALVGVPVLAWRRRRDDPASAATMAVLWWTTLYAVAASSLLEIGENERFRFELGPIPLVLAVTVLTAVVRGLRRGSVPGEGRTLTS